MATLRVYRGDQFVAPFELGEGRTRIGRGTDNHLVLEDHDKQVSRIHAEIWHERGRYVIADLNSQNGVWIGERQIKTEEPLPENVPITIGPYRLILEASAPTVVADAVDGAEMTRESGAFVEPTQLVDAVSSAPAPPSAHSQATKIPTANLPATPKSKLVPLLALGALAALAVFALVIFMTGRKTGEMNPAGDNNPTPRAPESTTTIPPNKTAEEIFQEHFTQAQLLLEAQNPAAAKEENRLALDALPDDPRGLAQQRGIEGILNPPPPDPATARSKPSVDANAKPDGNTAARDKIEEGKRALDERRYADAINLLEEAGRLAGSGNAPIELNDLLARAKSGRAAEVQRERQGNAQKALDEARVSAVSDVVHGVQKLQEARTLNPELAGIGDVEALLLQQARSQGTAALALAKNRHNDGRTEEASKLYTRAIQLLSLLPGGHEGIAEAKQRLDQLKR